MNKFTDALNRSWSVDLHIANMDAIEEHAGFSLDAIVPKITAKTDQDYLPWHMFLADQLKIFDVFYALVKDQADKLGLSKKDVRAGFGTDEATDAMTEATLGAIVNFFQKRNPLLAAILKKTIATNQKLMEKVRTRTESALNKIDLDKLVDSLPEITTEAVNEMIEAGRKSVTNAPAKPESPTPALAGTR